MYRIVYMPDNKWWLAQNVKIASYNGRTADRKWTICNKDECGYGYISRNTVANWGGTSGIGANIQGVCPPGWVLPLYTDMMTMFQAISPTISYTEWSNSTWNLNAYRANSATVAQALRSKGSPHCSPSVDTYGWASEKVCTPEENSAIKGEKIQLGQHESRTSYWYMDCYGGNGAACKYLDVITCVYENVPDVVRCFRQL